MLAGQFVRGAALDFFGGKRGRRLHELSGQFSGQTLQDFFFQARARIRTERRAIGVKGIGGKAEAKGAVVTFPPAGIKLGQASGTAEQENQNARSQRIERSKMPDLAEAQNAAHGLDHVVRRSACRLIDNQRACVRRRKWFAGHQLFLSTRCMPSLAQ